MPGLNNNSFRKNTNLKRLDISKISDIFRKIELLNSGIDKVIELTGSDLGILSGNFQEYDNQTRDLLNISTSISENISGDESTKSLKDLKDILTQIQNFMGNTDVRFNDGQNELAKVNKILSDIVDGLSGFKSLVKHLRMLGISTKIESVRLGLGDRGFYTLAEDVENLSTLITKKSLDIREKLSYLLNLTNGGITTIEKLARTQNEFTLKIVGEAKDNSVLLADKYGQAAVITENITGIFQKISASLSSVISSDLSGVNYTDKLEILESEFTGFLADSKKKIALLIGEGGSDGIDSVKNFGNSLKQKTEKLKEFERNLDSVVNNYKANLKKIEDGLFSSSNEVGKLVNNTSLGQNSILTEISKKLLTVVDTIERDSKVSEEMVASMALVADTIADLSGFVDEIDEIGTEVELIALNASVKAAKTGEEGAALGVLAESIQKLSIDAKNQTALIMEVLQSVMKTAEKLRNNFNSKSSKGNKGDLSGLSSKISLLLDNLNNIDSNFSSQIGQLNEKVLSLSGEINKNSRLLAIDKKVRSVLDVYMNEFDDLMEDSFLDKTEEFDTLGVTNKNMSSFNKNGIINRGKDPNSLPGLNKRKNDGSKGNGFKGSIEYI